METFENNAITTANYSNYLDTQITDFYWLLSFSFVFVQTADNNMKTIQKQCDFDKPIFLLTKEVHQK